MAEKRMFAKTIVLSDAFLDMPLSARCLYFTLGMLADDDGFINNPKSIMRQCGASEDDLRVLLSKSFVLAFDSGVIVIKHWRINNYLRNDRYTSTKYVEEKSQLQITENGSYSFGIPSNGIPSNGIPRLDKNSIDKNSIDKVSIDTPENADVNTDIPEKEKKTKYADNILLTEKEYNKLVDDYGLEKTKSAIQYLSDYKIEKAYKTKSDYLTIRRWVIDAVSKKTYSNKYETECMRAEKDNDFYEEGAF